MNRHFRGVQRNMSDGRPESSTKPAATQELHADSRDLQPPTTTGSEKRFRAQRWRSVAELAAKDEAIPASALEPLHWDSLSAIPETQAADVPDLDWLLHLNGLAQSASLPSNVDTWQDDHPPVNHKAS